MIDTSKIDQYIISLDIIVNDRKLLIQSLTHKTYSKDFSYDAPLHNERLEFLWDAVLWMIINEKLYLDFREFTESDMTLMKISMVRMENLANISKKIWIDNLILLWNWEEKKWGRNSEAILCDCIEWFIGFLYIDQWFEFVKSRIIKYIYNPDIILSDIKSYKAKLQELSQSKYKILPVYIDIEHEKDDIKNYVLYRSSCYINNELLWEWFGTNKKKAQEEAAKIAFDKMNKYALEIT